MGGISTHMQVSIFVVISLKLGLMETLPWICLNMAGLQDGEIWTSLASADSHYGIYGGSKAEVVNNFENGA